MADCITYPEGEFKKLEETVGKVFASELVQEFGTDIPVDEIESRVVRFENLKNIGAMNEHGEIENVGVITNSDFLTKTVSRVVFKLQNEKKILEMNLNKENTNKQALRNRIFELNTNIIKIQKEEKLGNIIDVAKDSINSWIKNDILDSDKVTSYQLRRAYDELAMFESVINTLLEYHPTKEGNKLRYKIGNKKITGDAESVIDEIHNTRRKLDSLNNTFITSKVNEAFGTEYTVKDLSTYMDISMFTSLGLDISRTDNPIASFIFKMTKAQDLNASGEYEETLNRPLNKLEKESGMDMTKDRISAEFLQKDSKGRVTPYLINEYSNSYFEHLVGLKGDLSSLSRLNFHIGSNHKSVIRANEKLVEKINKSLIVADTEKLISDNEDVFNSEVERLTKEVGEEKAEELVGQALQKYESYMEQRRYYRDTEASKKAAELSEVDAFDLNEKLEKFESINSPINFNNTLKSNGDEGTLSRLSFNNVAFAPRKSISGKESKFYDTDYRNLMNNEKKAKLFRFIRDKFEEYKANMPELIQEQMEANFIPDIYNEDILKSIQENGIGTTLRNKFASIMSTPQSDKVVTGVLDANNQPVKSVPIKYVGDKIRDINYRIRRNKDMLIENDEAIKYYEGLRDAKKAVKPNEGKWYEISKRLVGEYQEKIDKLKEHSKEITELIPQLEDKANALYGSKSVDLVASLKKFGLMSLNYKHKSRIVDLMELTRRKLLEQTSKLVGEGDTPLVNRISDFVTKGGESQLDKMVNNHLDASLYGELKSTEGFTKKLVGTDKKSRKAITKYKKDVINLKKDLELKKVTEEEFVERLNSLKEDINAKAGVNRLTLSKAVDSLNSYIYRLNLGWNPSSATANVLFGKLANRVEAAADVFFNLKELNQAEKLLRSSVLKASTGVDNPTAYKIRNAILKYGTTFDMLEDGYGTNRGLTDKQKKLGILNAMELHRRGEYYSQGSVLLARMHRIKLKTTDGKEVTFYDALDKEGNLKDNIVDREQWDVYTKDGSINKAHEFRMSTGQLVKRLHGNYDISSIMRMKKSTLGRLLMTFRSYLPEAIATRFEKYHEDPVLNYAVKGRYRTLGDLGFKGSLNLLKKTMLEKYFNNKIDKENSEYSSIDIENMRRNLIEVQWGLVTIAMGLLASAFFNDDDKKTFAFRHTFDLVGRVQQDIAQYFNPADMHQMISNPFPQLRVLNQVGKLPSVLWKYGTMSDGHHDTDYLIRNLSKVTPVGKQVYRTFYGDMAYVYK